MQITLINCNVHLLAIGIDMQAIGSGSLLVTYLPNCEAWEYDYLEDRLTITYLDGVTIPDVSQLGEVVPSDSPLG